jgi:hypothetical protein
MDETPFKMAVLAYTIFIACIQYKKGQGERSPCPAKMT